MALSEAVQEEVPCKELAAKKWESSGLNEDHAKRLRLKALEGDDTAKLGPNFYNAKALLIPYFDLKGKPIDFFRVRYLEALPGFAGSVEKPQRYAQPIKTLNEAYFPPLLSRSWEELAKDTTIPLIITEGELKAAAACSRGLPTIGIGGVEMWRATKRQIPFLPSLSKIDWSNRVVVVAFDSDAAQNPGVVRAMRNLSQEVLSRGARISIASIPPAKGGKKQGLDDLLLAEGDKALDKILSEAPPFAESDALWALNDEVFYVKDPGVIVEIATGHRILPIRFCADVYANRHYMDTIFDKEGNSKAKRRPLAKRWVEWEHRFQLKRMTYAPGKPRIFNDTYNTWPGWGCEPKRGDIAPWKWLLSFLFKSDPDKQEWFEQWCAYPIQHPGEKLFSSVLIWGVEKGTGKSFVPYALGGIYGENFVEVKSKSLKRDFNSWARNRQFVYGDEISGSDARIDSDWLKGTITQPSVTINEKYLPEYTVPDQMNYYFSSNHADALFIEDRDRRYFVHEVIGLPADRKNYEMVHKWLRGSGPVWAYEGPGAPALFHHLLNLDLRGFNPRAAAPETFAKERMIMNSKSNVSIWVQQLRENPDQALQPLVNPKLVKGLDLYEVKTLLRAYDPDSRTRVEAGGMGRALYAGGIRQVNEGVPIRSKKKGLVRLYAVRNITKWMSAKPKEIAEYYDKTMLDRI